MSDNNIDNCQEPDQVTQGLLGKTIEVGGELYYSVNTFADLTNRSPSAIRLLVNKGNRIRLLKSMHVGQQVFIPATELIEYPFCFPGRNKKAEMFRANGQPYTVYMP